MRKLTDRPVDKNLAGRLIKYKSSENRKNHHDTIEKISLSSKQSPLSKDEEME